MRTSLSVLWPFLHLNTSQRLIKVQVMQPHRNKTSLFDCLQKQEAEDQEACTYIQALSSHIHMHECEEAENSLLLTPQEFNLANAHI